MKKHVFSLGLMLVAALAFTNCAKQEVIAEPDGQPAASAGVPFELSAGMDTKTTTTDGATINWADKDQLNVFYRENGTTGTYQKPSGVFTFTSGTSFTGELTSALDAEKNYDWWVLYPYNEHIGTPANTSSGYLPIGTSGVSKSTGVAKALTQQGNSNKAHLAGEYFPLYGKVENVAADEKPSVALKQALSVLKIHVTNAGEDALTVTSVSVTAPEDIVGTYFIDFSGETPAFTKSGATYVSSTANLTVIGGSAIAKNGTADFYVAIKPFTQASAGVLTVSVNGYEKDITIPANTEFKPGKIKTVNFAYDYVSLAEPTSKTGWYRVEDASWLKAGDRVLIAANGSDFAMSTTQKTNNRDQAAVTKSTDGVYSTLTAGSDVQMFILEEGTVANSFAFKADNGDTGYIFAASSGSNYLKTQDAKNDNASFKIAVDTEGNASVVAQGTNTRNVMQYNSGNYCFACYASASQSAVAIYKYYGTYVAAPVISVTSDDPMEIPNTGDVCTIEYTVANPVAGKSISAAADVTWITDIDCSVDGEVSFIVEAQAAGAAARSGKVTLSYDGASDVEVTVNQAAGAGAASVYTYVFTSAKWAATLNGAEANWTSGKDGGGFNNDGFQVTSNSTGANGTTVQSFTAVTKVVVVYNTNKSAGEGTLDLKIGNNKVHSENWAYAGSGDGRTANYTCTFDIANPESGQITLTVNTTTNSIYVVGVNVTASGMTTP